MMETHPQTETRFPWYSRWGCFNHVDYFAAEHITLEAIPLSSLEEAIEEAMETPVPWRPDKKVFDVGPDGNSWWNYNPDWWAQKMFDMADPGIWEVFQTGHVDTDGRVRWYSDEPWWRRRPAYDWTYLKDYWSRPGGGGHYTYYNVYNNRSLNPDPSLSPLGLATGERLMYVRRR